MKPWTLACAYPRADSCRIILADAAVMKARGWTTELLLRHEIGATATADRAIILVSMLNERKDDDQETQTSFVTV